MARAFLRERLPWLFLLLREIRYAGGRERPDPVTAAILDRLCGGDLRVLAGPFRGMRYLHFASGSGLLPKIVGSYEMEIHGAVAASLRRGYRRILNIGCGEGYYAVGYARELPEASVDAYDRDVVARRRLRTLARLNGVGGRIRIGSLCRTADLDRLPASGGLVVSDCEGCEKELLDPQRSPALRRADLLVEMHDFIDPAISSLLLSRFGATHEIEVLDMRDREDVPLPFLERLDAGQRRLAVWEGRPAGMQWAWMRTRAW